MPKKTIAELQTEIDDLKGHISDLREKDSRLYKELKQFQPDKKPWYTSFGIWLAILLTLATLYLVYIFYMSETGHNVMLPEILNWHPFK